MRKSCHEVYECITLFENWTMACTTPSQNTGTQGINFKKFAHTVTVSWLSQSEFSKKKRTWVAMHCRYLRRLHPRNCEDFHVQYLREKVFGGTSLCDGLRHTSHPCRRAGSRVRRQFHALQQRMP